MTDSMIIIPVFTAMVIFFILQAVAFRISGTPSVPKAAVQSWLAALIFLCLSGWLLFALRGGLIVSLLLYCAVSGLYLFVVFSGFESSITIRLLRELGYARTGVSRDRLYRKYSVESIVKERLVRFLASGEVRKAGEYYERTDSISVFAFREQLSRLIYLLFPIPAGRS